MGTGSIFNDIYKYIGRDDLEVMFWIIGVSVPLISLFFRTVRLTIFHVLLKLYKLLFKLLELFPYRICNKNKIFNNQKTDNKFKKITHSLVIENLYYNSNPEPEFSRKLYDLNENLIDKSDKDFEDIIFCVSDFYSKYNFHETMKDDRDLDISKIYGFIK